MTPIADSPESIRSRGAALALGEIENLANEMSGLMRMGIPLAAGLRELAPSMRGNLRGFAAKLAKKLESGQDLSAALHEERQRLPVFFRAVVDAGIRSGDPSIALKSIAETARRIDEHRRVEFHALTYPLIVGLTAIGLTILSLFTILPWQIELYTAEAAALPWPLVWTRALMTGMLTYWWAILLGLATILLLVWLRPLSWRGSKISSNWLGVGHLPTLRNIVTCSRWSMMLEVLLLLLKRQVPLDESISLAASVALPNAAQKRIETLTQRMRAGQRLAQEDLITAGFPRAVASALGTSRKTAAFLQVLSQLEKEYRWRAHDLRRQFNGPWVNSISIAAAGAFVIAYIVVVIFPIAKIYYDIVNNQIN